MASVNVVDKARQDPRIKLLGKLINKSRFDALGRMIEIWSYCTEIGSSFMSESLIDACAEFKGFSKLLIRSDIGLGKLENNQIYIKGTEGRIEWLKNVRENGKLGGRPKKIQKPDDNHVVTHMGGHMGTNTEPKSNPITTTITITNKDVVNSSLSKFENLAYDSVSNSEEKKEKQRISSASADSYTSCTIEAPEIHEFVSLWNSNCKELAKVTKLSDKRKKAIKQRLKDESGLEYWEAVILRITSSGFCTGNGSTGWKADFDFLLQPDTHIKVLEGKYDDRTKTDDKKFKTINEIHSENNARMIQKVLDGEL